MWNGERAKNWWIDLKAKKKWLNRTYAHIIKSLMAWQYWKQKNKSRVLSSLDGKCGKIFPHHVDDRKKQWVWQQRLAAVTPFLAMVMYIENLHKLFKCYRSIITSLKRYESNFNKKTLNMSDFLWRNIKTWFILTHCLIRCSPISIYSSSQYNPIRLLKEGIEAISSWWIPVCQLCASHSLRSASII